MVTQTDDEYWNHNTAYHRWVVDIATRHHGDVLDAGCGDGITRTTEATSELIGRLHRKEYGARPIAVNTRVGPPLVDDLATNERMRRHRDSWDFKSFSSRPGRLAGDDAEARDDIGFYRQDCVGVIYPWV